MGLWVSSRSAPKTGSNATDLTRREILTVTALGLVAGAPGMALAAAPSGQLTWGRISSAISSLTPRSHCPIT